VYVILMCSECIGNGLSVPTIARRHPRGSSYLIAKGGTACKHLRLTESQVPINEIPRQEARAERPHLRRRGGDRAPHRVGVALHRLSPAPWRHRGGDPPGERPPPP